MSSWSHSEAKVARDNLEGLLSRRSQLARQLEVVDLEIDRARNILDRLQLREPDPIVTQRPWSDADEGGHAADKDYMPIKHQDVNDFSEVEKNYSHYTR